MGEQHGDQDTYQNGRYTVTIASGSRRKGVRQRTDSIFNTGMGIAGLMTWGRTGQTAIWLERGTKVAAVVSSPSNRESHRKGVGVE